VIASTVDIGTGALNLVYTCRSRGVFPPTDDVNPGSCATSCAPDTSMPVFGVWLGFTHAPRYTEPVGTGGGDNAAAGGGVVVVGVVGAVEGGELGRDDVVEDFGAAVGVEPPQPVSTTPTPITSAATGAQWAARLLHMLLSSRSASIAAG
jgi:hypothetical protein